MLDHSFNDHISATALSVEALLEDWLGKGLRRGEIHRPERLLAAMRHGAMGGGKRLRPFLTVETAALLGGQAHQALRAGTALELIHCYSLVHDDLPSMDNDDLRRGRPTVHKAYDEATAILAGDSLLTLAFDAMADRATHPSGTRRAALVSCLARAAGIGGMAGGQMLDLAAEGRFANGRAARLKPAAIRRLQAMKTGALIAASVEIGAIVAGATGPQRKALLTYAKAVGAAFQVADDILDIEASPEAMGKATGKDAGAGKATLVTALGLEAAKTERDRLVAQATAALAMFGDRAGTLQKAALFVAQRAS
jgi:farnesyl diphosphate synthase